MCNKSNKSRNKTYSISQTIVMTNLKTQLKWKNTSNYNTKNYYKSNVTCVMSNIKTQHNWGNMSNHNINENCKTNVTCVMTNIKNQIKWENMFKLNIKMTNVTSVMTNMKTQIKWENMIKFNTKKTKLKINKYGYPPHKEKNHTKWKLSQKKLNKLTKIMNGNKNIKALKILQWNMGSRFLSKKRDEIQAIMDDMKPDIMVITEANMFCNEQDHLLNIEGYNIIKPKPWDNPQLKYDRVIILIKLELNYTVLDEFMEPDTSAIWLNISRVGQRKLRVGAIYREHQFLKQPDDSSADIHCQEDRWRRILSQWIAATNRSDSIIIGDMNLDISKWDSPTQKNKTMIEETKAEIETSGFTQVIEGITRTWPGVEDSHVDHCWVNISEKIIQKINIPIASSDHNLIGIILRVKGVIKSTLEFKKRIWTNFNHPRYKMSGTD